ncbi:MAG: hypothetical protein NT067_04015 [Candidatus Diapherotrites archaeon]|nr:hypothetical protein [Candidatus Diapherotrites archaeon]
MWAAIFQSFFWNVFYWSPILETYAVATITVLAMAAITFKKTDKKFKAFLGFTALLIVCLGLYSFFSLSAVMVELAVLGLFLVAGAIAGIKGIYMNRKNKQALKIPAIAVAANLTLSPIGIVLLLWILSTSYFPLV